MTPTKNPKPAAPIVITAPGEYVRRDGRRTMVTLHDPGHPRWRWWSDDSGWHDDSGVFNLPDSAADDIVAKAPPAPRAATKPRPAKGNKATRRYSVDTAMGGFGIFQVRGHAVAQFMSRSLARRVCALLNGAAMKEAQRGGA